jgi:hypothetical protein
MLQRCHEILKESIHLLVAVFSCYNCLTASHSPLLSALVRECESKVDMSTHQASHSVPRDPSPPGLALMSSDPDHSLLTSCPGPPGPLRQSCCSHKLSIRKQG